MEQDDLKSLEWRIEQLEAKVDFIYSQLKRPEPGLDFEQPNYRPKADSEQIIMDAPSQEINPPEDFERLIGRVWLPRIFIVVLLLGVMWGFNVAINAGLLNQPVRCILGFIITIALLLFGERQIHSGRNPLGQVLLGGGLSIGVITVFAAHVLYHLISPMVAFPLDVLLVICGVYLTYRHHSEALGILSTLGGYLIPFLIESQHPSTIFFVSYETLLSVSFLLFAVWRRFHYLFYVSIVFFQLALFVYFGNLNSSDRGILFAGVAVQHVSLLIYFCFRQMAKIWRGASIYGTFLLMCGWIVILFSHSRAVELYLVFAIVYGILSIALYKFGPEKATVLVSCATFALTLYLLSTNAVSLDAKHILLLVEGALAVVVAIVLRDSVQYVVGALSYAIGFLILLAHPLVHALSLYTAGWVVLMLSLYLMYDFAHRYHVFDFAKLKRLLFIADSVLLLIFLTELTLCLTSNMSSDVRHFSVSIVWLGYAIAAIVLGIYAKYKLSRMTGILLLFLTLAKLILVDVPQISTAVRAFLFIALGGVGVAISRLFYKKDSHRT